MMVAGFVMGEPETNLQVAVADANAVEIPDTIGHLCCDARHSPLIQPIPSSRSVQKRPAGDPVV